MENKDINSDYQKVVNVGDWKWVILEITIEIFFCLRFIFLYREFSSPTWKKLPPPKVPIPTQKSPFDLRSAYIKLLKNGSTTPPPRPHLITKGDGGNYDIYDLIHLTVYTERLGHMTYVTQLLLGGKIGKLNISKDQKKIFFLNRKKVLYKEHWPIAFRVSHCSNILRGKIMNRVWVLYQHIVRDKIKMEITKIRMPN